MEALKLPSYSGFVMPKLTPVTDAAGAITDVKISYPLDLTAQMLEYSRGPEDSSALNSEFILRAQSGSRLAGRKDCRSRSLLPQCGFSF